MYNKIDTHVCMFLNRILAESHLSGCLYIIKIDTRLPICQPRAKESHQADLFTVRLFIFQQLKGSNGGSTLILSRCSRKKINARNFHVNQKHLAIKSKVYKHLWPLDPFCYCLQNYPLCHCKLKRFYEKKLQPHFGEKKNTLTAKYYHRSELAIRMDFKSWSVIRRWTRPQLVISVYINKNSELKM
jgi:hypothetical protein